MVRSKQAGTKARPAKSAPSGGNVINLMDALRRSMEASGGAAPKREAKEAAPAVKAPAAKKKAGGKSAKPVSRDQPQFKLPIPGGKAKAEKPQAEAPKAAAKPDMRSSSRKKAS